MSEIVGGDDSDTYKLPWLFLIMSRNVHGGEPEDSQYCFGGERQEMRPVNTILVVADKKRCLIFGVRVRGE